DGWVEGGRVGEVLAVEVRGRGRDEAHRAGVGGIGEPVEEVLIRLWPGRPPAEGVIARQSSFARVLAGEPPPSSGPAAALSLGETVIVPIYYHGFFLPDQGMPAPWEGR